MEYSITRGTYGFDSPGGQFSKLMPKVAPATGREAYGLEDLLSAVVVVLVSIMSCTFFHCFATFPFHVFTLGLAAVFVTPAATAAAALELGAVDELVLLVAVTERSVGDELGPAGVPGEGKSDVKNDLDLG